MKDFNSVKCAIKSISHVLFLLDLDIIIKALLRLNKHFNKNIKLNPIKSVISQQQRVDSTGKSCGKQ